MRKNVGTSTKKWDAEDSKPHYATWGADRALRLRQREQRLDMDQATVAQATDLAWLRIAINLDNGRALGTPTSGGGEVGEAGHVAPISKGNRGSPTLIESADTGGSVVDS